MPPERALPKEIDDAIAAVSWSAIQLGRMQLDQQHGGTSFDPKMEQRLTKAHNELRRVIAAALAAKKAAQ